MAKLEDARDLESREIFYEYSYRFESDRPHHFQMIGWFTCVNKAETDTNVRDPAYSPGLAAVVFDWRPDSAGSRAFLQESFVSGKRSMSTAMGGSRRIGTSAARNTLRGHGCKLDGRRPSRHNIPVKTRNELLEHMPDKPDRPSQPPTNPPQPLREQPEPGRKEDVPNQRPSPPPDD